MPSARPCLTLLIVFLSAFAIWEALSFLDSHVLQAEVETEHFVAYRKTPPRTTVFNDVTSGEESGLDITTESSPSNEEGSATWMHAQEEKFNKRRLRVETVCGKYKDVAWTNKYVGREFLFDLDNRLAYCRHGKVGTSSLMEHFVTLSNLDSKTKKRIIHDKSLLHEMLPKLLHKTGQGKRGFDVETFAKKHSLLTFSFVRHPFERIISAYENKILYAPGSSDLFKRLEKRYNDTSWASFANMILDMAAEEGCSISSDCHIDVHIRPFFHRCSYCCIKYDVIGMMEDFDLDFRYIAMKQNLTVLVGHLTEALNDTPKKFKSQSERIGYHFSMLEPSVKLRLYKLYKIDFEMFGYSATEFL